MTDSREILLENNAKLLLLEERLNLLSDVKSCFVAACDGGVQIIELNHAGQLRVSAMLPAAQTGHLVQRARPSHGPGAYRLVEKSSRRLF